MKVPGHTPGSIVIFIPEYSLLLTGDDWNPCTWMWFPSSLPARKWRNHMISMIRTVEKENGQTISHVICPHQPMPRTGQEIKEYLEYMSDERIERAPFIEMETPINTHHVSNENRGWTLVFDMDKT